MAENAIDKVRAAEAQSEEKLREAAVAAQKVVDNAHIEAAQRAKEAQQKAKVDAAAALAAAQAGTEEALRAEQASLDAEMDELAKKARSRQSDAVRLILDSLA